jgi:hypothetical protein
MGLKSFDVTKNLLCSFITIGEVGYLYMNRRVIRCAMVYLNNELLINVFECCALFSKQITSLVDTTTVLTHSKSVNVGKVRVKNCH